MSLSEKYGISNNDDDLDSAPMWGTDPNGIPFNRRSQSDLYSRFLLLEQKNFDKINTALKSDKTVGNRIKTTLDTVYIPQDNRDGVLAAITPAQTIRILCNKKLEILKALAASSPREANNPRVRGAVVALEEATTYFMSKNQKDMYNERQNIKDEMIKTKQEIEQKRILTEEERQQHTGIISKLRGGKQ